MGQARKFLLPLLLLLSTYISPRNDVTASICRNRNIVPKSGELYKRDRFRDLVSKSYVFADKSLLIKDFVESPHNVTLVTCPKSWGKSINMDMIKTFLQPEFDSHGKRVVQKNAFNYKLFELGEADNGKITKFNIAKHRDIMDKYLGQWPVVRISLAHVEGSDFNFIVKEFRQALGAAFVEHKYMLGVFFRQSNEKSSEIKKKTAKARHDFFEKCLQVHLNEGTEEEAIECLKFLCERLHEHFGKKPFILIDDYDRPLKYFFYWFQSGINQQVIDQTVQLLHRFVTAALSDNDHFEKALITAVMNLEIPRIFAALPNLKLNNMVRNEFYKHYGFTEDEVSLLLRECKIKADLKDGVKEWYGGYTVTNNMSASLYNFRSVNGFLGARAVGNFWTQTSNAFAFAPLFANEIIKPVLCCLVDGKSFLVDLNHLLLTTDDYIALEKMSSGRENVTETGMNLFLMLIFSEGYLTIDREQVEESTSGHALVKAPNRQTMEQLKKRKEWSPA